MRPRPAVLVTRPAPQAGKQRRLVAEAGAEPFLFPALEILPPEDPPAAAAALRALLPKRDLAVFVSTNAVAHGLDLVPEAEAWPVCAAVGRRTAAALRGRGIPRVLVPAQGFTSEALLALPELQHVAGKRVLIVRGPPGRELLAETLRARGAEVDYFQAYRRRPPARPDLEVLARWCRRSPRYVLVSSNETLENLFHLAPEAMHPCLRRAGLVGPSARLGPLARRLGFTRPPRIADNATDEALLRTLRAWMAEDETTP